LTLIQLTPALLLLLLLLLLTRMMTTLCTVTRPPMTSRAGHVTRPGRRLLSWQGGCAHCGWVGGHGGSRVAGVCCYWSVRC